MSEYDAVRAAVNAAEATTEPARKAVYNDLTKSLQLQIAATQPQFRRGLSDRIRKLKDAISEFELDFKNGSVRHGSSSQRLPPDPSLDTVPVAARRAQPLGRVRTVVALTLRFLRHLSRIGPAAAVWIVIEPLMQMSIIVVVYSIAGATSIMDMPPIPFVVLGVAAWFMFRMIMLRSALMPIEPALRLLPRVRLVDIIISRAATYGILYTWAMLFFLALSGLLGVGAPVDNLFGAVAAWLVVAALASGIGLILRSLVDVVPVMARFVPWIGRIFFYTSGVVFVSEQLPDFLAKYMLWSPVLNAVQSMRSAYFISYESQESSLGMAACWAIILLALGLTLQAGLLRRNK